MQKIITLVAPILNFIKTNIDKIILFVICGAIFYTGFFLTTYSLKKLKPDVFSYYPFDKFFPKSGHWSVVYFITTILFLGILVYFMMRGGFYLSPA